MQIQTLSNNVAGAGQGYAQIDPSQARSQAAAAQNSQAMAPVQVNPDAVQAARKSADPKEVRNAVDTLNKTVAALNQSLQFEVDTDTGMNVVKLIDVNSKEVLRQFPSQEMLSIAKAIDKLQGMLIKDKA